MQYNLCIHLFRDERTYASSKLLKNEQPRDSRRVTTALRAPRVALVMLHVELVELIGFEPTTPCLQSRCSPN